jgi:PAS domain S-box-containing protein
MASQIGLAVANTRLYLEAKASERKFRGLVENAEDVIYLTDLDGRIVYANPAMSRLLGYDPAVLCADGWPMLSLIHEDDRDRLATLWTDRAHDQPARSMELRVRHADGSRVLWFSQTAVTLRDEAGAPTGLQCIAQDITARRAWQQQMMQAERLADLGRMAATIAHEIRNPLGAIVNSINVLKRAGARSAREERVDEARLLDIVAEETDRLNAIVSEVLMFARPPARAVVPCDILELVESTTELFARGGSLRAGVRLRVQCDASLPLVPADPNQMRQVLWNLLTNAADAAIAGAIDIVARAQDEGRTVAIEVTDDGPGVKDVTAVLEPFYTTRAQGTGLGLAIVARIVRDHGGSIAVANVPGRGARFTIALPVSEPGRATEQTSGEASGPPSEPVSGPVSGPATASSVLRVPPGSPGARGAGGASGM